MLKFSLILLSAIFLGSCSSEDEVSHIVPTFGKLKNHHKIVMLEFRKEIILFGKQLEKDKEIQKIASKGNLSDSDKERINSIIREGKLQTSRMIKVSNDAIESTIDIMSLMSAINRFCDHDNTSNKISGFISTLQKQYGNKKNIDIKYWESVWSYDREFQYLDPKLECRKFSETQQDVDTIITNTIKIFQG